MTPQEELDQALAELAAANAELAAAKADLAAAKKAKTTKRSAPAKKRTTRPMHHTPGFYAGCSGTGERFTGSDKVRIDNTPVITKEINPMNRPNDPGYTPRECLFIFDIKNGLSDSDSWRRCKCAACAEIRKG